MRSHRLQTTTVELEPTTRSPRLRILAAQLPDLPSKGPQTAPTTTTTVCRTLRSRHDHTVSRKLVQTKPISDRPLCSLEEGVASSPHHSPPDWTVGCQATRGGLPIGCGARVVLALSSLAGGNALCPSSEQSFDPRR